MLIAFAAALCGLSVFLGHRPPLVALAAPQATAPQGSAPSQPSPTARLLALHFDTTALTADELSRAVGAALTLVDTRMRDGQTVAITMWNGQMRVLQDFTADRDTLRQALHGVARLPVSATGDASSRVVELHRIIAALGAVDAKKALVYFTGATTPATDIDEKTLHEMIEAAQRANLAIYHVDVRGVAPAR
jgi:VWFA-related protein